MLLRVRFTVLGGRRVPASFTVRGEIAGALDESDQGRPILRVGNKTVMPYELDDAEYEVVESTPMEAQLLLKGGYLIRGIIAPEQKKNRFLRSVPAMNTLMPAG
jgi:hypothetical protein